MGMDIADIKENTSPLLFDFSKNCFKVANLTDEETILNPPHPVNVSNLKDRYLLGEQLGCGQFGVVRVCSDKFTGERLACKSISKDTLVTQDDIDSIELEIAIMAKLAGRHPNVVNLKAVYEEEDSVHLLMELCAGGELFDRIEKSGKYSEFHARVLFKQLMQVVKFCHDSGVVHRDLKPENILMATMSSSSPIKLADFGLATFIKPGEKLSGTVGSPFYVGPEVLSGGYYNQAADVWSAGVILYILLSGVPPFWGQTDSEIFDAVGAADLSFSEEPWDHITSYAKNLIWGMLCVDPSQRLTADEVLAHPWWMEQLSESGYDQEDGFGCEGLENDGGCSFSTQCVSREQDSSFSSMAQLDCKSSFSSFSTQCVSREQDSSFSSMAQLDCKSSFSSFLPAADNNTLPNSGFGGFSFDGNQPSAGKLGDSSPKRSPDSSSQLDRREEAGENQTEAAGKSETKKGKRKLTGQKCQDCTAKRKKITVISSKILYVL
ncbi:PREDICTED: calcium-dependent protein kinase 11-like [Camelina sativa]|uniref:Calcium-dependent protein kinase 11-like n=1 Tax=Camelina sativa TaxID=90675 RepID=A0ABM1QJB5_CAMSA|nr:PREDICTED: calcium-dependent protein kinase 11-like [Camelina sativa]